MSSIIIPGKERWQPRAIRETGGNKSMLGCFVLAVLGLQHGITPPRFGSTARIDKDGIVYSNMQDKYGKIYRDHCLGPVQDIIDNFRGLADHLKLEDEERKQMMDELRKWFAHDARADQTAEERGLTKGG